jgi:YgiT-type zinc finger domain-containing protein
MSKKYRDCYFCGGIVEERLIPLDVRWQKELFITENVPVGVCNQCGEKALKPEVAKTIDLILKWKKRPSKTINACV